MAERTLTLPTSSALSSAHRLSANDTSVQKTLSKVSRPALIDLVQEWLRPHNIPTCRPVLGNPGEGDGESIYDLHQTIDEVRQTYKDLRTRKGNKREIVDRIVDGDWRDGVSLRQLAMADIQYLLEHPTSQRWIALKLSQARAPFKDKLNDGNDDSTGKKAGKIDSVQNSHLPRFEAPIFLHNLQTQLGSLLRAHYHLTHLPNLPLTLLRIAILDSPYNSQNALQETSGDLWRTLFIAFPDNTPYIYVAVSSALGGPNGPDGRSLRSLIVDAVPKAFSKPRERYVLESTSMSAKSLGALLMARGPGRSNAANGGWSVFAKGTVEGTPLMVSTTQYEDDEDTERSRSNQAIEANMSKTRKRPLTGEESQKVLSKKRKLIAQERFGISGMADDGQGIDKLSVRIEDAYPITTTEQKTVLASFMESRGIVAQRKTTGRKAELISMEDPSFNADEAEDEDDEAQEKSWKPRVTITFQGIHIFAGIRALIEEGAIDGRNMPGWMTGEEGVTLGVVKDGKIVKGRGDGA